jgi:isoleucyl-tRNA synthetase
VHLVDIPETPAAWRDDALAAKWATVRKVRRVVLGALEVERREKTIGASLEASPVVFVDQPTADILATVPFDDICITSGVTVQVGSGEGFALDDVPGVTVQFQAATGDKCERCWKILPDVGTHAHPGTCARCDAALSAG